MKKKISKVLSLFLIATLLVISSIPFVSAVELLDESKIVSISLSCGKTGYTFEVFKVATLDSTSTSPYETSYNALVTDIDAALAEGDTATILSILDGSTLTGAESQGTWSTSATSTTKTFSNLAQGVYYIKAINYPAGVKSVTNSVVALPYYDNGWVYEIPTINLANKVVDGDVSTVKTITNSTQNNVNYTDVSLGDTVDFEIKSTTAGSSEMKLGSYIVYDDMSAGLTLDKDSFNVSLLTADGTKITDLDPSEYVVIYDGEIKEGEMEDNDVIIDDNDDPFGYSLLSEGEEITNTVFKVSLTNEYLQTEEFYGSDVYYVSITYSAILNSNAVIGTAGNPNTEVKLKYSNKNGVTSEVEGNTVYVYTYGVKVNKTNPDNAPLAGAEFALYKAEADAKAETNVLATGTSDSNGIVKFYNTKGEEIKLQSGTYHMVETKAPDGYSLFGRVIEVNIDVTYGTTLVNGTYVTNSPVDGYAVVDVVNATVTAPETGGMGTMLFTVSGILLLAGSAVLFMIAKKKRTTSK